MEDKKVLTIEELTQKHEEKMAQKDKEIELLKKELDIEKRKVASFKINGITQEVKNKVVEEEKVVFDFDF